MDLLNANIEFISFQVSQSLCEVVRDAFNAQFIDEEAETQRCKACGLIGILFPLEPVEAGSQAGKYRPK